MCNNHVYFNFKFKGLKSFTIELSGRFIGQSRSLLDSNGKWIQDWLPTVWDEGLNKNSGVLTFNHVTNVFADKNEIAYLSNFIDNKVYTIDLKSGQRSILIDSFVFDNYMKDSFYPKDFQMDCHANLLGVFIDKSWYNIASFPNNLVKTAFQSPFKYISEIDHTFEIERDSFRIYKAVLYYLDGDSLVLDFSKSSINNTNDEILKLYPNPFTNELKLDLETFEKDIIVELFDLQGRKVLSKSFQNKKSLTLKTDEVSKGSYILKLKTKAYEKDYKVQKE